MADFPDGVYSPRTKANKSGIIYEPSKATVGYAEDIVKLDEEVVAIEEFLSPKLLTLRPEINIDEVKKWAVPDQLQVGVIFGYSMPVYNNDHEELFFKERVPYRWNGSSNPRIKILVALSAAEDVGDKFNFELCWNRISTDAVIPGDCHCAEVDQTVLVGRNAQYATYDLTFTIDYDIDGVGNELQPGELLNARLRRVAASELEVDNEILVLDWVVEYQRDKFGVDF